MNPKLLLLSLFCALLCSCASTTLMANGKPILRIQADAQNVTYTGNGVSFHADSLQHSNATVAGGIAARNVLTGVTAGVTAVGAAVATSGVLH
jgi:hypothetical protein